MKAIVLVTTLVLASLTGFTKDFRKTFTTQQTINGQHLAYLKHQDKIGHVLKAMVYKSVNGNVISITYVYTDFK